MTSAHRSERTRELALLLVSSLTVMAGATISPALPALEQSFRHLPNVELLVKLVMTLPALFIVIGAPLVGALLDRGRKTPLLFAALVAYAIAGTSGFFCTDSLYTLLVGRALLGLAVAGVMTACTTLASHYFAGPELSRFMGLSAAVGSFGGVLFLVLGGLLAEPGWRYPFLLYLIALMVLPLAMRALDEPKATVHQGGPPPGVLSRRKLALAYGLATLEIALLYMVPLHYPFFANQLGAVGSVQTGVAIATMLLVMALVSTFYRHFSARMSFVPLHGMGLLLLALGYLGLGSARDYTGTFPGLMVAGVGLGLMRPNLMVWIMSFTPPALRGRVFGGVTTFFFLGQFASPLATTPSVERLGLAGTFMAAGVVAGLGALVCLVFTALDSQV